MRFPTERVSTALLVVVALLLGANTLTLGVRAPQSGAGRVVVSSIPVVIPSASADEPPAGTPAHLAIPVIGVDADIVGLGLNAAGELEAPAASGVVGWFAGGVAPGGPGPAVLVGHVDSRTGPAVFWRLRSLRPGDVLTVQDAAAQAYRFVVTDIEQYAKNAFPTGRVYGSSGGSPQASSLRLVTCGGSFNRSSGHYVDNVVVYADRAS